MGDDFLLGTSIAPTRLDVQRRTVNSWLDQGFQLVSFNCREEIGVLQEHFPRVLFVQVNQDGRERFGRPLICVDDILDWFAERCPAVGGFVNSDILLQGVDAEALRRLICQRAPGSLVYGRRVELHDWADVHGRVARFCYDFFAFDPAILHIYPRHREYYIGYCHWDYFMIQMALISEVPLKELAFPFAYHKLHEQTYDWDKDIIAAALRTFQYMWPHLEKMCAMDWYLGPVVKQLFEERPRQVASLDDVAQLRKLQSAADRLLLSNVEWMTEKLFLDQRASLKYGPPAAYAV